MAYQSGFQFEVNFGFKLIFILIFITAINCLEEIYNYVLWADDERLQYALARMKRQNRVSIYPTAQHPKKGDARQIDVLLRKMFNFGLRIFECLWNL